MEVIQVKCKSSKSASQEDVISTMPNTVITNILNRLPIQDAVRTDILSTNWRFKWTMLTHLVFDDKFFEYLQGPDEKYNPNGRIIISRLLLHLKRDITKFVLYIDHRIIDVEDVNHWVLFLSRRGLKELSLVNMSVYPLMLPTKLYSCTELKRLKLYSCCFRYSSSFRGFPSLLSLDMDRVTYQNYKCGEFIPLCQLLEILIIGYYGPIGEVKLDEIAKLRNLKTLSLSLCLLDNITTLSSSGIFEFIDRLPKLQELNLDFRNFKLLAEAGAEKRLPTVFRCLKTLTLDQIDFRIDIMVSFVIQMISSSSNLQTLKITATYEDDVKPTLGSPDLVCNITGHLQLQSVVFASFIGSENEICLIKYLLGCSPLLKKIDIGLKSSLIVGGVEGKFMLANKLLKLHRASPVAEIDIC